jgi:hypothetical protein
LPDNVGKVKHKHDVYDDEQPVIVDAAVWERVQTLLPGKPREIGKSAA